MTQLEQVMYAARAHALRTRDGTSCSDRCSSSFLATAAVASAFALILLAAPGHAQTVAAVDGQATGRAEDSTIRPFHVKVPEKQLVDLRRRIGAHNVRTVFPASRDNIDSNPI